MLDNTSLVITIIGAINWLLVGLFRFDLVAPLPHHLYHRGHRGSVVHLPAVQGENSRKFGCPQRLIVPMRTGEQAPPPLPPPDSLR